MNKDQEMCKLARSMPAIMKRILVLHRAQDQRREVMSVSASIVWAYHKAKHTNPYFDTDQRQRDYKEVDVLLFRMIANDNVVRLKENTK